jgi:hypothetical protein
VLRAVIQQQVSYACAAPALRAAQPTATGRARHIKGGTRVVSAGAGRWRSVASAGAYASALRRCQHR